MNRSRHTRPSPALIISMVALLVAVGGTAVGVAKIPGLNRREKKQVRRIARRLSNRRITKRAHRLSVARAGSAATAISATTAANAASLGGIGASAYVQRSELAPIPPTGLALSPGWAQFNSGSGTPAPSAYRDQLGVVHLSGLIRRASGSTSTALTLPPGLRPGSDLRFPAVCDEPGLLTDPRPGIALVYSNGTVIAPSTGSYDCTQQFSLDGISFRAGG